MTDQTVEETKDAGSDEGQVEQDGSSVKDKIEHAFDSMKDKFTGDDKDSAVDKDDAKQE